MWLHWNTECAWYPVLSPGASQNIQYIISYHIMSCHVICHAMPCHAMPCQRPETRDQRPETRDQTRPDQIRPDQIRSASIVPMTPVTSIPFHCSIYCWFDKKLPHYAPSNYNHLIKLLYCCREHLFPITQRRWYFDSTILCDIVLRELKHDWIWTFGSEKLRQGNLIGHNIFSTPSLGFHLKSAWVWR